MFKQLFQVSYNLRTFDPMPLPKTIRLRKGFAQKSLQQGNISPFVRKVSRIS